MIRNNTLKLGLLIGLLGVIINVIIYLVKPQLFGSFSFGLLLIVIYIVIYFIAVFSVRKSNGGYISFKEAFLASMGIILISTFIELVFKLVLHNVIDPGLSSAVQEGAMESMRGLLEWFGVPEDEIEQSLEDMDGGDQYTVAAQLKGFVYGIIFSAILSLIIAAIVKKKKETFDSIVDNT